MLREPAFAEIRPRTRRLGARVVHVDSTPSTMRLARDHAEAGAEEGLVVVAEEQTAGVGRHGRAWHSPRGGLLATLLLRPRVPLDRLGPLSLAAGVALADAVRRVARIEARLKWPNDLLVEGRKVAGILVESRTAGPVPDFVLVGLGVNGDARREEFPPELRESATSLAIVAGRHVCMPAVLKRFLEDFEPLYDALVAGRPEGVLAQARRRLDTLGRRVRVSTAKGPLEGRAVDLGPQGQLAVESEAGRVWVDSGEAQELRETS